MSISLTCPNCNLINPADAVICDCGYDFRNAEIHAGWNKTDEDEPHGFFIDRHAGKFLLSAFLARIILTLARNASEVTADSYEGVLLGEVLFLLLVGAAVIGYIARWRRNRRS